MSPPRDYWFGPNIGSTDLADMFRRRGAWKHARERMTGWQFYVQQLTEEHLPVIGPNSIDALLAADVFRILRKRCIPAWCEGALFKEEQDTEQNLKRLLQARHNVVRAGGMFAGWTLDEPLRAGKQPGEDLDHAIHDLHVFTPALSCEALVVLIEPYPFFDLDDWKRTILPNAAEAGCVGVHIDIDAFDAYQREGEWWGPKLLHDVQNICDVANDVHGLDTGIIITGNAAVEGWNERHIDSAEYCLGARRAADALATIDATNVDRIVVQSWHRNGEGEDADTSVPRNLPEHVDLFGYVVDAFDLGVRDVA